MRAAIVIAQLPRPVPPTLTQQFVGLILMVLPIALFVGLIFLGLWLFETFLRHGSPEVDTAPPPAEPAPTPERPGRYRYVGIDENGNDTAGTIAGLGPEDVAARLAQHGIYPAEISWDGPGSGTT